MDVAQKLIFVTSYCIYSKLLMILFQNNDAYSKRHSFEKPSWSLFMLKYYFTVLFQQFTKTLIHFFYLSSVNENLETCTPV